MRRLSLALATTALLGLAASLLGPASARAQDAADVAGALAQAREQVLFAQYPEAIAAVEALLSRSDLAAQQRNAALELLATAQIANRQTEEARRTLATLYARDPGHRLTDPDASPPVVSAFARAREAQPAPISVSLQHTSPGTLTRREPPQIEVRPGAGGDAIQEVRLAYRAAGEPGWSQVVMNVRDGVWVGRIPVLGAASSAHDVAYYVTALAPSGAELAHVGSEAEPLQLRIPGEAPTPASVASAAAERDAERDRAMPPPAAGRSLVEEPAFWIVLGLVVAGAAVGIGVGVGVSSSGGPEQGTLGTVTLMR